MSVIFNYQISGSQLISYSCWFKLSTFILRNDRIRSDSDLMFVKSHICENENDSYDQPCKVPR